MDNADESEGSEGEEDRMDNMNRQGRPIHTRQRPGFKAIDYIQCTSIDRSDVIYIETMS